jgi:hypothetical protein
MAAIRSFTKQLFKVAAEKRLWLRILGEVEEEQIWLVRSRENWDHPDPKMLILAGFHGEEKAGPYAILKWLSDCDLSIFRRVDLSFIPIVNPLGFKKGVRYSVQGERNNQGFCHSEGANACKPGEKRSREGEILYSNIDSLLPLTKDGYLSLHEDALLKEYYVYTFDKRRRNPLTKGLLSILGKHFPKPLNGLTTNGLTPEQMETYVGETGTMVVNGWVNHRKLHDGSLEDFLYHANVPRIAVSETPGLYTLKRRVNAGSDVIGKFIELSLRAIKRAKRNGEVNKES